MFAPYHNITTWDYFLVTYTKELLCAKFIIKTE